VPVASGLSKRSPMNGSSRAGVGFSARATSIF